MDKNFSWRRFLLRRLNILAVLSLAACIAGQLGGLHWFAGLFGHFVPHYAAVFLLAALFCPGRRRWLWAVCAAGAALWLMQPFVLERPSETRRSLIWYNVHLDNPQAAAETAALLAAAPDMLALAEIDTADGGWAQLRHRYPYGCERESDSPFALALWSRRPARCVFPAIIPISAPLSVTLPFTPSIRRRRLAERWHGTGTHIWPKPPA
mgnify:CR=1 FL=1